MSRSSTALRRYLEQRSQPVFRRLAEDERGLPAVAEFFDGLIKTRCSGEHARRGCMVSTAHADTENGDPDVCAILDQHHQELRDALYAALLTAEAEGQLAAGQTRVRRPTCWPCSPTA